jgi:hypothetical protein
LSSVTLQNGDTLTFVISAWSYKVNAAAFGAPANPADASFSLLTDPLLAAPDLSFSLESYGGGVSTPVNGPRLLQGYLVGSLYQGPISEEYGSVALSPQLSGALFAGPSVLLTVEDWGGGVTLGLSPYTLMQSLEVNLSGGRLSVGGVVADVTLDQAQAPSVMATSLDDTEVSSDQFDDGSAPEPSTALLMLGGACLLLLADFAKRRRRLAACLAKTSAPSSGAGRTA